MVVGLILVLSIIGFGLSLYMFVVEQKLKKNPHYKPVCNLSDRISCTKPLQSKFAQPFGISNALLGLWFYPLLPILIEFGYSFLVYYLSLAACCVSFFLALILYFRIKAFCIVCSSLYVVNALLLIVSYWIR
jgi:vitamin-K-epoxide reductase (warfarin-sensitive)